MKRAVIIAVILMVVGAAAVGCWWYMSQNPDAWLMVQGEFEKAVDELGLEPEEEMQGMAASGFVEAEVVAVTTELGGAHCDASCQRERPGEPGGGAGRVG